MKKNKFKKEYEDLLVSFTPEMSLDELSKRWYTCFRYFLKSLHVGFTDKSVNHLFYEWKMNLVADKVQCHNTYQQWFDLFCEQCKGLTGTYSRVDHLFQAHHTYIQLVKNHLQNISTSNSL